MPEGVSTTAIFGRQIFGVKGGTTAIPALASLLQSGKYRPPTKVKFLGKGVDAIEKGLDKLMNGASGTKYVVSL